METRKCVFCEIITGKSNAEIVYEWPDAIAIIPLNPVCDGHVLVIPKEHVNIPTCNPFVTGLAFRRAAEIAQSPCNFR